MHELTREVIEKAFEMMGEMASRDGKVIDIAVYGGSCLLLASNIRDVTRDVDAVFLTERDRAYRFSEIVGKRLGLPDGWLHQAVKSMAPPRGNPEPNLLPFGDYPKSGNLPVGLRVFLPTPEYLLAMKLLANRQGDEEGVARDRRDIHALMRVCGIDTKAGLTELLRSCYPSVQGITARMEAKIEDVLEDFDHANVTELRPGTLAEAVRRAKAGEQKLATALAEFLDEFYLDATPSPRRSRIEDRPEETGDARIDAYVGAVAEHLANRWGLGSAPVWVDEPCRFLRRPWFIGSERTKAFHLAESPLAFRRRMIFTEAEPLRRVRMPKDGRWWAYETMRTGLQPPEADEAPGMATAEPR